MICTVKSSLTEALSLFDRFPMTTGSSRSVQILQNKDLSNSNLTKIDRSVSLTDSSFKKSEIGFIEGHNRKATQIFLRLSTPRCGFNIVNPFLLQGQAVKIFIARSYNNFLGISIGWKIWAYNQIASKQCSVKLVWRMAAIAPWFRQRLTSYGPRFGSQAHHLHFLKNVAIVVALSSHSGSAEETLCVKCFKGLLKDVKNDSRRVLSL